MKCIIIVLLHLLPYITAFRPPFSVHFGVFQTFSSYIFSLCDKYLQVTNLWFSMLNCDNQLITELIQLLNYIELTEFF